MRAALVFLAVILSLACGNAQAAEAIYDRPDDFLAHILASDFAGDPEPRFDHCYFTDGRYIDKGCINQDCAARREAYVAYSDPLIIVTSWRIANVRMESKTKARITVHYRVIAKAEGDNEHRRILALATPKDEEVVYRVWRRKGEWFWVNPPELAHVGYEAVRTAVAEEVQRLADHVAESPDRVVWSRPLPLYKQQLAELDALRPLAEAQPPVQ